MPHSDIHKKKLKKNLFVLFLLFVFCALIFGVTIVKMAHADDHTDMLSNMDSMADSKTGMQSKKVNSEGAAGMLMGADDEPPLMKNTMEPDSSDMMSSASNAGESDDDHTLNRAYSTGRTNHQEDIVSFDNDYRSAGDDHREELLDRQQGWFDDYEHSAMDE